MRFLYLLTILLSSFSCLRGLESENTPQIYYPNFCHQLTAISCLGDTLELNDGSVWSVNPSHAKKVFLWSTLDPLVIFPVKNLFSYYHYKIQNLVTNDFVEVDLELAPVPDSEFSKKIVSIDLNNLEVELSDNSLWKLNANDEKKYQDWVIGDLVIVGMNVKNFLSTDKFMLINASMNNYCSANTVQ